MQTSVHIEKCTLMFERSIKHQYTLKNVNLCLRALANIGTHWKIFFVEVKNKFHWENHILPNTMRISWLCLGHIRKYGPHASKWGANVTPPACGRRGTLTPHFSAYRAIFSDMSSPESGYCPNIQICTMVTFKGCKKSARILMFVYRMVSKNLHWFTVFTS